MATTTASKTLNYKDILLTSRPFWWVATAVPFFVGYLTHGAHFSWPLAVVTFYFLFPYNLLMYGLNDIFDYESDMRNPRKAGIEGAVLAKSKHLSLFLVILALNIPYVLYIHSIGHRLSDIWLAFMLLMVVVYSVKGIRFKEIPVVDSLVSAFHYTSPFLFGVVLAFNRLGWIGAFLPFYVWAVGNHAFGAIQDIKPDREAGIESIATRLGSSATLWFVVACYAIASVLPIYFFGGVGIVPAVVLLSYVLLAARCLPFRKKHEFGVFRRSWRLLTYMNYINGAILSIYLILLYKASH